MTEKALPKFGGTIPSRDRELGARNGSLNASQRSRGRPPALFLGEAKKPKSTFSLDSNLGTPNCGVCLNTLPLNPILCEDCQIWNDPRHVFQCLRDPGQFAKSAAILKDLLAREHCALCQEIANAVVTRFQTSDISNSEEIFNTEITVSGPYCLGDTAFILSILHFSRV